METLNMFRLVETTLREDDRLESEGKLLKNKIMELTFKQDKELIERLLREDRLKDHFFTIYAEKFVVTGEDGDAVAVLGTTPGGAVQTRGPA